MTHQEVPSNGLRFAALSDGDGPLVLLLHGFPDTAHTWDHVRPAVAAAGFRAVSPFLRGYAPTEIPAEPPSIETMGRDVLGLIEALGYDKAIVVAHDWGVVAAYAAYGLDPSKIERLMVIGVPHPMSQRPTPKVMWGARHFFALNVPGAAERIRADNFAYIEHLVRRWSPTWDLPPGELDATLRSLREPGSLEAAVSYYRVLRAFGPPPILRVKVEVPTVAVAGDDDPIMSASHYERARNWHTAGYDVVSLPGGHFVHRESPDAFVSLVLDFLAR